MNTATNENTPYRIVLADDHAMMRAGLRSLLGSYEKYSVVGEAGDGNELLRLLRDVPCDLVVLDISMPGADGLETLQVLRELFTVKVLILTLHNTEEYFRQAAKRGIDGYLLKEDAHDKLIWAIDEIRAGREGISPNVASLVMQDYMRGVQAPDHSFEILTRREKQIILKVADGSSNKDIAAELNISPRTVEGHRARAMEKLGAKNVAELTRLVVGKQVV